MSAPITSSTPPTVPVPPLLRPDSINLTQSLTLRDANSDAFWDGTYSVPLKNAFNSLFVASNVIAMWVQTPIFVDTPVLP